MVMTKQFTIAEYLAALQKSMEDFDKLPKEEQKKKAIKDLIKTGVLNSDGTQKEHICTID